MESAARGLGGSSAAGGLLAPAAMLIGAIGLLGVWTAAPKSLLVPAADASAITAVAATQPVFAGPQGAVHDNPALTRLLVDLGAPVQLSQPTRITLSTTAADAVASLRMAEANMVSAADLQAEGQLKHDQAAFRATGLNARAYMAMAPAAAGVSPLELRDARVLAARLDVDTPLAKQVERTAHDLIAARTLNQAAAALPLATPVDEAVRSSGFGMRLDPFTRQMAFHPGQDFAGRYGEPIHVTAPGVISFVGQRSGYGNCVEVDHGYELKTRYGHLSGFTLGVGSPVKTGDVIGRMGSTGRSTGVHLHYEVWASGRLLNPTPFLSARAALLKG